MFSWNTLPIYWHSANITGPLSDSELNFLTQHSFPLITIEKYQALNYQPNGTSAENKIVNAAKQIKNMLGNKTRVIFYLNSVMDWYMYDLHQLVLKNPEWLLKDKFGKIVYIMDQGVFDLSIIDVRKAWLNTIKNVFASGFIDGVFADRGGNITYGNLTNEKKEAWLSGHIELIKKCQDLIGNDNILIYNNADQVGITGRMFENFGKKDYDQVDGFINDIYALQNEEKYSPKVVEVHAEPCTLENFNLTLTGFLIGAPNSYAYYACSDGWSDTTGWLKWYPEYDKKLGKPLGKAEEIKKNNTIIFTRKFESNTNVELRVIGEGMNAKFIPCIYWSDGYITGPQQCYSKAF